MHPGDSFTFNLPNAAHSLLTVALSFSPGVPHKIEVRIDARLM
jgi:hypothetical protein